MQMNRTAFNVSISTTWTRQGDASSEQHRPPITLQIQTPPPQLSTTSLIPVLPTQLLSQQTPIAKYRTKDHAQNANLVTYSTLSTSLA